MPNYAEIVSICRIMPRACHYAPRDASIIGRGRRDPRALGPVEWLRPETSGIFLGADGGRVAPTSLTRRGTGKLRLERQFYFYPTTHVAQGEWRMTRRRLVCPLACSLARPRAWASPRRCAPPTPNHLHPTVDTTPLPCPIASFTLVS